MWKSALIAAAAMLIALAQPAVASADGADGIIADLQDQGFLVHINWLNGFDTKPLALCTVVNVNNPDRSGAEPKSGSDIYVDVRCPNHDYD